MAEWAWCKHARSTVLRSKPPFFRGILVIQGRGDKYMGIWETARVLYDHDGIGAYSHISGGARVPSGDVAIEGGRLPKHRGHIRDRVRFPSGDVAIERGRPIEHSLQQYRENAGTQTNGGVGVLARPQLPPHA